MASRAVVCSENEALADYIYGKREHLMEKPNFNEKLDSTFTVAYRNVCDYSSPISNLREAGKVRGIGPWMLKQLKDFFGDGPEHPSQEDEAPQAKKPKSTRRYLPQKNSAPYALLITLHRGFCEGKKYMMKQELIDSTEVSGLSRMQIQPSQGSSASGRFGDSTKDWYSGWSSMKTLITKGLVVKSSCPAKYMLTEEGVATAEECALRGGLSCSTTTTGVSTPATAAVPTANERADPVARTQTQPQDVSRNDPASSVPSCQRRRASSKRAPEATQALDVPRNNHPPSVPTFQHRGPQSASGQLPSSSSAPPHQSSGSSNSCSDSNKLALPPLDAGQRFSDLYRVILILDDRESFTRSSKGITSKLRFAERLREQYHVEVEIRHLPVGDAIWIAHHMVTLQDFVLDFIVERKSVEDLWSSIRDTRYKQQKLRLLRCGISRLIYLIEGDPNLTEASDNLKTAALTTEILDGFDIQRTRDIHDTISRYGELTNAICRRYNLEVGGPSTSRCSMCYEDFILHSNEVDKERVRDVFGVQLVQVRHVTEDIALSIVEKFPTVFLLAQAYSSLEGDVSKQENLLTGLPILNKNKTISSVISKNVYKFFWAP